MTSNLTLHQSDNTHSDKTQMCKHSGVASHLHILKELRFKSVSRQLSLTNVNLNKDKQIQSYNLSLYCMTAITSCCICSIITTTYVVRKAAWIHGLCSHNPSLLKRLTMLEVQLMKRLLGHEPCPKPTLRPYTHKDAKTSILNACVCT